MTLPTLIAELEEALKETSGDGLEALLRTFDEFGTGDSPEMMGVQMRIVRRLLTMRNSLPTLLEALKRQGEALEHSSPDDIRALGLSVAVHNDYRLAGEAHTFWLFTRADGMSFKGEGRTDAEALNQVRAALTAHKDKSDV